MKIIRHGKKLYGFVCPMCDCVWRAGEDETTEGKMGCPDCGAITDGRVMWPLNTGDCTILAPTQDDVK